MRVLRRPAASVSSWPATMLRSSCLSQQAPILLGIALCDGRCSGSCNVSHSAVSRKQFEDGPGFLRTCSPTT